MKKITDPVELEASKAKRRASQARWRKANPEKASAWKRNNKDLVNEKSRARYASNIEEERAYNRQWIKDNPDKVSKYNSDWRERNPDYMHNYYVEHKEDYLETARRNSKRRMATDPAYRMKITLRKRLNGCIRKYKVGKVSNTLDLLGCSIEYFTQFMAKQFQPGMTWANHGFGDDKWHVEHRKPCDSFDLSKEMDQRWCFHYSNLQPMWQPHNLSKSSKLNYPATALAKA